MKPTELLVKQFEEERKIKYKGGMYFFTQTDLAYNSNRIEGSRLTKDHTRSLFETKSILANKDELIRSDDVIETNNHFRAFDYMLDNYKKPLSEQLIKDIHRILKASTSDADLTWFNVGEYKSQENMVGDMETTCPEDVQSDISRLLEEYLSERKKNIDHIIDFHVKFEKIHPFQDGNGRVGRMIMFKECLSHNTIPFIIDAEHKEFYYRGLREYFKEKGYLMDTCLSAQDKYTAYCKKLVPDFDKI
jgi:Fic family protein